MRVNKTLMITYCAIGVALNVILGEAASMLNIPLLFLDTIGTIFISAMFGIPYGIMTGVSTNLLMGLISGITAVPFALVSIAVAIIVGGMTRNGLTLKKSIVIGIVLAVVCPLIGTPIRIALFGGLTGSGTDVIIVALRAAGKELFTSTFIGAISANIVDKIISCMLVYYMIQHPIFKKVRGYRLNS